MASTIHHFWTLALCVAVLSVASTRVGLHAADLEPRRSGGGSTSLSPVKDVRLEDFTLPTTDGKTIALSADPAIKWNVICFLGAECPLARVYGPRLERMSNEYAPRGVRFIGINSNIQDSMEDLKSYVSEHGISFPVAKDHDRAVALQMGARRTPEVFVLDHTGQVCYQGRIDDQYKPGITRNEPTARDLRDALDQLIIGKTVTTPRTEAVGCLIALPHDNPIESDVTYCNQVARVLQQHCVECHREGEIGPFALQDYDEVVGWADMALEVIDEGRMPPWHADPDHGSFSNARRMPARDKALLREWVEAGMPYGDARELPEQPEYVSGWRLPQAPDVVLEMRQQPYAIPAEGTVEYQYFVVDPGFTEDKWVRAAQVIPGDSSVVHHCICFMRPPDGSDFRGVGLLSGYVPGQNPTNYPNGFAQRVTAGSRIVFQMHYTPNGKPAEDITRLGLVFADPADVTHEVYSLSGVEQEFEIPAGAAHHVVDAEIGWFPKNGFLLSITPHMHLRGKSFELRLESDQDTRKLLSVPAYDFNWQHNYDLTSPMPLDEVDKLSFTAVFDNSSDNPTNPDPTQTVTWGDQTWEEMAVTFLSVAQPLDPDATAVDVENSGEGLAHADTQPDDGSKEIWSEANTFADQYIGRFDKNGDQLLTAHELPDSVRMFRFHSYDHDRDGYLTRDEIAGEAYRRINRDRQSH